MTKLKVGKPQLPESLMTNLSSTQIDDTIFNLKIRKNYPDNISEYSYAQGSQGSFAPNPDIKLDHKSKTIISGHVSGHT